MKLNNKGYMLVEIIVSFSMAFAILIALTNLVLKYKDVSNDIYYDAKYLNDKVLITRNIMQDLEKGFISNATLEDSKTLKIDYELINEQGVSTKETRKIKINGNKIIYGQFDTDFVTNNLSYYTKNLEPSLIIGNIENCSNITNDSINNDYFCARINITSMYSDVNYDLIFFSTNISSSVL